MNSENEDDPIRARTPESVKRKRCESSKKYDHKKQKFRSEWLVDSKYSNWLCRVPNNELMAKCKLCPSEMTAELSVLKKHALTKKHLSCVSSIIQKPISNFINDGKKLKEIEQTKRAEILLCGFLSEHNLPFNVMGHLSAVCKQAFPDSKISQNMNLGRTKATSIVKNVIGKCHSEDLANILKSTCFSVIIDEIQLFTDSDSANQGATAQKIFDELIKAFNESKIPLNNIIGFASDGCNSMMGQWNSVSSRFNEHMPGVFIQKCICHSLHLCASSACKTLPRSCEDLARDIFNYFKSSSKRICQYKEFQEFCNVSPHKILYPAQTSANIDKNDDNGDDDFVFANV
ncbi:uncharacterized protein LOC103310549 [Acyrthosiphon pisum]|uniref:DUF4371 domain-containing protein n=1 Tax=Acyrthosiphon pisum TaxID=7029 RepID=A0A8R2B999_ACYPI|nr:uncharacterized protein LOC103310549 [Acyrthosiphon pisum]|eukprot:XP_008187418.1 PREDICTED: uncharacterized protein LOC103310549 [Acyrthosiphon pisum]